jgi:predicted RNA-binding protein (virulence factor B family)
MIQVGKFNQLRVVKEVPFGVYLDGANRGEILLPKKYVPASTSLNQLLEVFIYFDSEDKIIATTQRPRAVVESFAHLKVVDVNPVGAFLDWGLDKDLLVPKSEQHRPLEKDKSYLVYVKLDNQGRLIASSKIDYYLDKSKPDFKTGDEVSILIAEPSPLGRKVIVAGAHWGVIHAADVFQPLSYGKKMRGYIKNVRADGKIDVILRKMGQDSVHELAKIIMAELHKNGGFLPFHDKSDPLDIQRVFKESKKNFKNAIGYLYKRKEINIESSGIRLIT